VILGAGMSELEAGCADLMEDFEAFFGALKEHMNIQLATLTVLPAVVSVPATSGSK
jgi:hypothetical protein